MAQLNVNIRMDSELKNQFERFCSDVGLSMSAAFNVFAKASVRCRKIPFEIAADPDQANPTVHLESLKAPEDEGGPSP